MSDWVVRLIEQSGYLGVGFLMFLETIFPPIPSEVIMPVAGVAAAQGQARPSGRWSRPGTAGAMLGNIVWYLAARALGRRPAAADHRPLRPLADDQLARSRARRALVRRARHRLRLLRPAAADHPLAGLGPGRAARHALPQLLHRLDARHRGLDHGPRRRRLQARGECRRRREDDRPGVQRHPGRARRSAICGGCGPTAISQTSNNDPIWIDDSRHSAKLSFD